MNGDWCVTDPSELGLGLGLLELALSLEFTGVTRATGRCTESVGAYTLTMYGGVETVDVLGLADTRDILSDVV